MNRDLINQVLYYGTLAPSAHNTQPWAFQVKDESIFLKKDKSRALGYSDKNGWETYLSLGACLENLSVAAQNLGILENVFLFPNGEQSETIAEIRLSDKKGETNLSSFEILKKRQTNRSNYSDKPVEEKFSKNWKQLCERNQIGLIEVRGKDLINQVAEIQREATITAFADKEFRRELSGWVRNNLTKEHDGMPGYVTNIPLPMSFLGPFLIKNFNIGLMQSAMEKKWILSSPLILILTLKETSKTNLINVGRIFEQIALDITSNGLVYAPLGAVIEMENSNKNLRNLLKIKESIPVMLIRVGYSNKKYKPSPKRLVEEVFVNQ